MPDLRDELDLLDLLREQALEIAALKERLGEASVLCAEYEHRIRNLTEQVKLLTSGPQNDPAKRAWLRWWW